MMYVDFTAGEKAYKLRLNTRNIVALEKQLGCNPIAIFGNGDTLPTITTMITILNASLQQLNHGLTMNDAYDIWDAWIADGHNATDFIKIIIDVYKVSGLLPEDADSEKN